MYTYIYVCARICVTWLLHECDITQSCDLTHSCVWSVLLLEGVRVLDMRLNNTCAWHDCACIWNVYVYAYLSYMYTFVCVCVTWLVHECDMTHSWVCSVSSHEGVGVFVVRPNNTCVWHDCVCVYIYACVYMHICIHVHMYTNVYVWHDSFMSVTWRIHECGVSRYIWVLGRLMCSLSTRVRDVTVWVYIYTYIYICIHTYMYTYVCAWHDCVCVYIYMYVYICIHTYRYTYMYVWSDSFMSVTWLIHECDMTRSWVRHDLFMGVTWLIHGCDVTHCMRVVEAFDVRLIGMWWLRLVDSLKM